MQISHLDIKSESDINKSFNKISINYFLAIVEQYF